jgi:gamma-glutamylcyclotransferase (GGCT)/AIG2-like uncharacterized protein YtfP
MFKMVYDPKCYFLYGTLRLGEPNYYRFDLARNSKYQGKATIQGARMYDLGGYPCVVLTGEQDCIVAGEIVEFLNEDCEHTICRMEIAAGYEKTVVDTSLGLAHIFVYESPPQISRLIEGGDWIL